LDISRVSAVDSSGQLGIGGVWVVGVCAAAETDRTANVSIGIRRVMAWMVAENGSEGVQKGFRKGSEGVPKRFRGVLKGFGVQRFRTDHEGFTNVRSWLRIRERTANSL
jgi:hypothetical protein